MDATTSTLRALWVQATDTAAALSLAISALRVGNGLVTAYDGVTFFVYGIYNCIMTSVCTWENSRRVTLLESWPSAQKITLVLSHPLSHEKTLVGRQTDALFTKLYLQREAGIKIEIDWC